MTNLHDARVAAFKAEWEKADAEGDAGNRVSRGLAAADAVVTEEMIAEVLRSIPDAEPGDRRDPATVIAEYLHSALFGEVAGDE